MYRLLFAVGSQKRIRNTGCNFRQNGRGDSEIYENARNKNRGAFEYKGAKDLSAIEEEMSI